MKTTSLSILLVILLLFTGAYGFGEETLPPETELPESTLDITDCAISEEFLYHPTLDGKFTASVFEVSLTTTAATRRLILNLSCQLSEVFAFDGGSLTLGNRTTGDFTPLYTTGDLDVTIFEEDGLALMNLKTVIDPYTGGEPDELVLSLDLIPMTEGVPVTLEKTLVLEPGAFEKTVLNPGYAITTDLKEVLASLEEVPASPEDDWIINPLELSDEPIIKSFPLDIQALDPGQEPSVHVILSIDTGELVQELFLSLQADEPAFEKTPEESPDPIPLTLVPEEPSPYEDLLGIWISPDTAGFTLSRRAVKLKFWLEDAETLKPSLVIYENSGGGVPGEKIMEIPFEALCLQSKGRGVLTREILLADFYSYRLKAKELDRLTEETGYLLGLVVDNRLATFNGLDPVLLPFELERGSTSLLKDSSLMDRMPKKLTSKSNQ